jgi:hypothetical protein
MHIVETFKHTLARHRGNDVAHHLVVVEDGNCLGLCSVKGRRWILLKVGDAD